MYECLDFILLRAPLLPIESYLEFGNASAQSVAIEDPRVRAALAIASPSLLDALKRSFRHEKKARHVRAKLHRFLVRMSTRPTPFGMFAGVAFAEWGARTDLSLGSVSRRTRADMGWLLRLVQILDAQPHIRTGLRWRANGAVWQDGGFFTLDGICDSDDSPKARMPATPLVRRALAISRTPVSYSALKADLLSAIPGATSKSVEDALEKLWQLDFLQTDLMPPLTADEPLQWIHDRLVGNREAQDLCADLEELHGRLGVCDSIALCHVPDALQKAAAQAERIHPFGTDLPLQVDVAFERPGQLASIVAEEAVRAAELLLRLTPFPEGPPHVAAYRAAFIERYGVDRDVPLPELLNPGSGLGPLGPASGAGGSDRESGGYRAETLQHLALSAIRAGQLVVELDEAILDRLQTQDLATAVLPASMDLNVFVLAESTAQIDAGRFQVMVGPNWGTMAAGRNLGRFAHLLGGRARAALESVARSEEAFRPEAIIAELSYLPRVLRSANMVIRPAIRTYELCHGVSPGVEPEQMVPASELAVGIREGVFSVRWVPRNVDVCFASGHMLNGVNAPPECRLLAEINRDKVTVLNPFDWGPAGRFAFLPRVQVGRSILHCAQWKLDSFARLGNAPVDRAASFIDWFARWRELWKVPRRIYLTSGDYRLLYDLDDPAQVDDLRDELLGNLRSGSECLLQEGLPGPEHAWLTSSAGGHHLAELVVSMVLRRENLNRRVSKHFPGAASKRVITSEVRLRPPGSDWIFFKLYGPRSRQDEFIAGPLADFCGEVSESALADRWFFLRYSDPDPHLRVRFHGSPERLTEDLYPTLCRWGSRLIAEGWCHRFGFDTYEREIERYGGPEAISASESIFAADSRAVVLLLRHFGQSERLLLALCTTHHLLSTLDFADFDRLAWLQGAATARQECGEEYRRRREEILGVLLDPARLGAVDEVLGPRHRAVTEAVAQINRLQATGQLSQGGPRLCSSHLHMHCNRLWGDQKAEARVLGLLARALEAIVHLRGKSSVGHWPSSGPKANVGSTPPAEQPYSGEGVLQTSGAAHEQQNAERMVKNER